MNCELLWSYSDGKQKKGNKQIDPNKSISVCFHYFINGIIVFELKQIFREKNDGKHLFQW